MVGPLEALAGLGTPNDPEWPFDPDMVTPGVIGFFATLLIALATMALMWDMNRRVRRINDRADIRARIAEEVAEHDPAVDTEGATPGEAFGAPDADSADAEEPGPGAATTR